MILILKRTILLRWLGGRRRCRRPDHAGQRLNPLFHDTIQPGQRTIGEVMAKHLNAVDRSITVLIRPKLWRQTSQRAARAVHACCQTSHHARAAGSSTRSAISSAPPRWADAQPQAARIRRGSGRAVAWAALLLRYGRVVSEPERVGLEKAARRAAWLKSKFKVREKAAAHKAARKAAAAREKKAARKKAAGKKNGK